MKYTPLMFMLCTLLATCSTKRESTYEENLATCSKKFSQNSKSTADDRYDLEQQVRECLKGSLGPNYTVKSSSGDSITTRASQGKAMVLFFWMTSPNAPADFQKLDQELFNAMNLLYRRFQSRVDFIGVPFNDFSAAKKYLADHPLYFPQAEGGKLFANYDTLTQNRTPYLIFINTKGRVTKVESGSLTNQKRIIEHYTPIIDACINNAPYTN